MRKIKIFLDPIFNDSYPKIIFPHRFFQVRKLFLMHLMFPAPHNIRKVCCRARIRRLFYKTRMGPILAGLRVSFHPQETSLFALKMGNSLLHFLKLGNSIYFTQISCKIHDHWVKIIQMYKKQIEKKTQEHHWKILLCT